MVAINPAAALGRGHGVGAAVAEGLARTGATVVEVRQPDFARLRAEVAREVAAGTDAAADALVVVGGDGMVGLGVNVVGGTPVPLGLVPTGTGNDAARGLGIPLDEPQAALQRILAALDRGPRRVDLGRAHHAEGTSWFFGALSAGFDAAVNARANRMRWPRSERKYTLSALIELLGYRPPTYTVTADGFQRTFRALLVAVANHQSIGGGMLIAPDARIDDGLLDLFAVDRMSRLRFVRLLPKVFHGEHIGEPEVSITPVTSVRISAVEGIVAYADGERIGPLPVRVEVVPRALRLLA